jgi:hypothetical protein
MRKVVFVTIALVLIAAAGCRYFRIKVEDEGPIIVKNGSMTVDTADDTGQWNDDGDWSNDTTGKQHGGDLWVLVIYKDGSFCPSSGSPVKPDPAHGHPVQIESTDSNFKPKFNVAGSNPPRTKVSPKNDFVRDNANHKRLQHEQAGEYIKGVKLPGGGGGDQDLQCDFDPAKLNQIKICSSKAKCEDATPVAVAPPGK